MKSLFYFFANHSINWSMIWSDVSIYVCIWLILVMLIVIWAANNYRKSVKYEAEEKQNRLVVSLSHELDMINLENSGFREAFKNYKEDVQSELYSLRERLKVAERKRDSKGLYLPSTGKGHGKKKDLSKTTEEELITEAKRRYPIGTLFYSALGDENPSKCVCNGGYIFQQNHRGCKNIIWAYDNTYTLRGFLYHNGVWAEIIK